MHFDCPILKRMKLIFFLLLQTEGLCRNEGICVPSCDEAPFYRCDCTDEWEGQNCTIKVNIMNDFHFQFRDDTNFLQFDTQIFHLIFNFATTICKGRISPKY